MDISAWRGRDGLGSRTKLLVTVTALCAVIAGVGYLGLYTVQQMMVSLHYFEEVLIPGNISLDETREGLRHARQQADLAADADTPSDDLIQLRTQYNRYMADSRRAMGDYASLQLSDAQHALVDQYLAATGDYDAASDWLWSWDTSDDGATRLARFQTVSEPQADRLDNLIGQLIVLEGQRSNEQSLSARSMYEAAWKLLLVAIGSGVLGTLALGIFVARSIASPREEAAIAHRARFDQLTGVANRAHLDERLREMVVEAGRRSESFALLLLDLDRFKQVNDTYGHQAGDRLLQEVARRLQATLCSAEGDDGTLVARLGGDEFAVIVPRVNTFEPTGLVEVLHQPIVLDDIELAVGPSVGVAIFPDHGQDASTLLRHADVAMYAAKTAQSGTFAIFEAAMDERHREHIERRRPRTAA
jgi:diguanylate cyclase (GGDEF)-like protein